MYRSLLHTFIHLSMSLYTCDLYMTFSPRAVPDWTQHAVPHWLHVHHRLQLMGVSWIMTPYTTAHLYTGVQPAPQVSPPGRCVTWPPASTGLVSGQYPWWIPYPDLCSNTACSSSVLFLSWLYSSITHTNISQTAATVNLWTELCAYKWWNESPGLQCSHTWII